MYIKVLLKQSKEYTEQANRRKSSLYIWFLLGILIILCTGQTIAVEESNHTFIKLEINGQMIADANGAQIIAGRSMVPLKTVTESLGIPVLWFNSSRIIRIDDPSRPIYLKIGDSEASIDGQKVQLDVPPMLEGGQTLVPLRFIAEALRAEIEWFPDEKLVKLKRSSLQDVTYESYNNQIRVFLNLTNPDNYNISRLSEPERLVIDLPNTQFADKRKLLTIHHSVLTSIRVSQFQEEPSVVRVVFDLPDAEVEYKVYALPSQKKLIIDIFFPGLTEGVIEPELQDKPEENVLQNKIIVIDPGHGGKNPGAIGFSGYYESEVNYDIAQRLNKLLQDTGAYTIMTRKAVEDPGLYERADISNENRSDLFISVHADAHPKPETRGSTVYAHYNASEDNWALAWYVHEEIIKNTGLESKGLRAADFVVLRETLADSILIETAYMTNEEDEALLKDPDFRQKIAEGIYHGIIRYYTKIK